MKQGFSLLEVMVALVIASLALSWFLYFLSEVHYIQGRARERLRLLDDSYARALWIALEIQEKNALEKKDLQIESLAEDPKKGPYKVVFTEKGIRWELYLTKEGLRIRHKESIKAKGKKLHEIFSGKTIKLPEIGPIILGH